MADLYVSSFANDAFLAFVDKASENRYKEKCLYQTVTSMLESWGTTVEQPDPALNHLHEAFQPGVCRVVSFCQAVTCLLDPQPMSYGCNVKHCFQFARYSGAPDFELCLKDNLKTKFWQKRYEEEQACAAAAQLWGKELATLLQSVQNYEQEMEDLQPEERTDEKVGDAVNFTIEALKKRSDVTAQLRPDACHRLDHAMVVLFLTVARGPFAQLCGSFYTLSQQLAAVPEVAETLAILNTWKSSHQESLNVMSLDAFIKQSRGRKASGSDFDLHECERLAQLAGGLTPSQYQWVAPLMLGRLFHEARPSELELDKNSIES